MTKKKWALRRSPTVPQEAVQLSDGRWVGIVHQCALYWEENGRFDGSDREHLDDLVPLQTAPKKTLRCWVRPDGGMTTPIFHFGWIEVIERAPGDKLAETVRKFEPCEGGNLWEALREYDEATK